jgi:predicted transcriptional regulator
MSAVSHICYNVINSKISEAKMKLKQERMKGYRSKSGEKVDDSVLKVKNLKELAEKLPKARRNKSMTKETLPDMFTKEIEEDVEEK